MPIYDIQCLECNNVDELLLHNTNDEIKCTKCGSIEVKKLMSATSSMTGKNSFPTLSPGSSCCGNTPNRSGCEGPGSCCKNIPK